MVARDGRAASTRVRRGRVRGGQDRGRPTGPRIGPAAPEHAGEILTVQRAAYVTEAQRYAAPGIPPLVETLAEVRADLARADGPEMVARAAWLGPRLVGSVRGRVGSAAMEVVRFSVAPDVQGLGVGRALLAAVEAAAPPSVVTFWLLTGARSPGNIGLYTAAGYRPTGTALDAAGVELMRMERAR